MEHFYQNIQGWFNYESIYDAAVQLAPDTAHFVEIGSWRGRSSCYLGVVIANSGKNIRVDCVDTWKGSLAEDVHQQDPAVVNDTLYDEFLTNTRSLSHILHPVRLSSMAAVEQYADNSLDFVLIDGSHEYEDVVNDITKWLQKVKPGSMLAGDDWAWPGVKQAVAELLPDADINPHLGLWKYTKP
jgi:predicted O-methyltransferase YrrM